jgi:hypothetical protein
MIVSRREFLGAASGAVSAALVPLEARLEDRPGADRTRINGEKADCILIDGESHCGLPESCIGYTEALEGCGARCLKISAGPTPDSRLIILPGCISLPAETEDSIERMLSSGSLVVVETGAGFMEAHEFRRHRDFIRRCFGVRVEAPINLWQGRAGRNRVPYVDYIWPLRAKVRDFTCAVPLAAPVGEVIAWADRTPIALRRKVGKGMLVFLGSPLGPALLSGDREAAALLSEFRASA